MPAVLLELIEILLESGEAETFAETFEVFGKKFMGSKFSKAKKAIKNLSAAQNLEFKELIGDKLHKHIEKNLKTENKSSVKVVTPKSSWVEWVEWDKASQLGRLKTKKSPKVYKLPFFPRSAIITIQRGASPGKTIWRQYWRKFGKGSVANKTANMKLQRKAARKVKVINTFRGRTLDTKTMKVKRVRKTYIRSSNVKNTGAKGVKITIVKPKIKL